MSNGANQMYVRKAMMIQTQGKSKGYIIYCDIHNTKFWEAEGFELIGYTSVEE